MTVPYNPYAADGGSKNSETVPLDRVIKEIINASLVNVHVCLPGQVVGVTSNNQVNVQPMLQRAYVDGSIVTLPIIQDVPVWMPRGADYYVKLPVAVNDTGVLLFNERSLDRWLVGGGVLDPQDNRKFDLSDAIFMPGLYPFNDQVPGNADDMVLKNGDAMLTLQKTGKYLIANQVNELMETLDQLLVTLQNAMVLTALGPQPFIASTQAALAQVKTQIDSLKGS